MRWPKLTNITNTHWSVLNTLMFSPFEKLKEIKILIYISVFFGGGWRGVFAYILSNLWGAIVLQNDL